MTVISQRNSEGTSSGTSQRGCRDGLTGPHPPQFIVAEDGSCGLIYEHAAAEGPPIISLVDHVIEYT